MSKAFEMGSALVRKNAVQQDYETISIESAGKRSDKSDSEATIATERSVSSFVKELSPKRQSII